MVDRLAEFLQNSRLHEWLSSSDYIVATVQTVHILGIAVVLTVFAMMNVRLMRRKVSDPPLAQMSSRFMPWAWLALAVLAITGCLLTICEPARELYSTAFRLKMTLILPLVACAALVQVTLRRNAGFWGVSGLRRSLAVTIGTLNLLLCVSIVAAGRLIAYLSQS